MLDIKDQKTIFETFVQSRYAPVKRSGQTYSQTYQWAKQGILRCLAQLKSHPAQDQSARLMRDELDFYLKRCHDYCIKERIGAHYREVGVRKKDCDFEHVIPKALTRELLIYDSISIDEALNIPTCLLSKNKHRLINNQGNVSTTPSPWDFWQRYRNHLGEILIETFDGIEVDLKNWNWPDHYRYFTAK